MSVDSNSNARQQLMGAIEEGSAELVRDLIETHHIDLDFIDSSYGLSPLQLAIDAAADAALQTDSEPDLSVVSLLLRANASPSFVGPDGKTAADIAREYGWAAAATLLDRK